MIALDRLRERAGEVLADDVALEREAARAPIRMLDYALGNQRVIRLTYDLTRGRPTVSYQLDGRTVVLDLVSTSVEVAEAYDAWRSR